MSDENLILSFVGNWSGELFGRCVIRKNCFYLNIALVMRVPGNPPSGAFGSYSDLGPMYNSGIGGQEASVEHHQESRSFPRVRRYTEITFKATRSAFFLWFILTWGSGEIFSYQF